MSLFCVSCRRKCICSSPCWPTSTPRQTASSTPSQTGTSVQAYCAGSAVEYAHAWLCASLPAAAGVASTTALILRQSPLRSPRSRGSGLHPLLLKAARRAKTKTRWHQEICGIFFSRNTGKNMEKV